MDVKTTALTVKAAGPDDGLEEGVFVGYASVFGNVDSYGDIVEKGAFTRTLAEWQERGDAIPVLWGHDMADPFANVGAVTAAEEDDIGLKITAEIDLENPTAQQVYRLLKGRRVSRMSFAYSVRDSETAEDGTHLKDLDLYEVSVVPVPANERAEILAVKDLAQTLAKAGRTLSAKNETALREARDAIDSVLSSLGEQGGQAASAATEDDQEKASAGTEGKDSASDEEPRGAKSSVEPEDRKSAASVDRLAALNDYALFSAERSL